MGLTDKLKAGVKNVDNRLGQSVDSAKYDSKISDQRGSRRKYLDEASDKMYKAYLEGKTELTDEVKDLFDKAKECDAEIEKLEKEKEEMKAKAHDEREANRKAAE